jgi:hypothetical protein
MTSKSSGYSKANHPGRRGLSLVDEPDSRWFKPASRRAYAYRVRQSDRAIDETRKVMGARAAEEMKAWARTLTARERKELGLDD